MYKSEYRASLFLSVKVEKSRGRITSKASLHFPVTRQTRVNSY